MAICSSQSLGSGGVLGRHGGEATKRHRKATKWVVVEASAEAAPWRAWDVARDKESKRIYYDMISVDRVDEAAGPVGVGSQYHCVHELGDIRFTITDWNPPLSFESDEVAFDIPVHFTTQVVPAGSGSVLRIMYDVPEVDGDPEDLRSLFEGAAQAAVGRLVGILDGR